MGTLAACLPQHLPLPHRAELAFPCLSEGRTGPHCSVKLHLLAILGKALKPVVLRTEEAEEAVPGLN